MKCSLTGQNTRILAKAVNSFSRIGNELYLEANPNGLTLRTVNDSQTAFAVMNFETGFFTDFKVDRSNSDEFSNKCKISTKSCLGVFKNMRQVEKCQITLNSRTSKILFQFNCLFDTIKTHNVSILEHEILSAVYMTDNAPNRMTAPNKLFTELISNFRMYDNEITIEAETDLVVLKNNIDMQTDKHLTRTKLTLKSEEFETYHITKPTKITFCLKELRAILNFADALSLGMTINFESAGKAVVFAFGSEDAFTANFVMSTLEPYDMPDKNETNKNTTMKSPNNTTLGNQTTTQNLSLKPCEVIDLAADDDDVNNRIPKNVFPPRISTPRVSPPRVSTPRVSPPRVSTPRVSTPRVSTARVYTPRVSPPPTNSLNIEKEVPAKLCKRTTTSNLTIASNVITTSYVTTMSNVAVTPSPILVKDTESEEIRVCFRDESETANLNFDEEMEIPASPQPNRRRPLRKLFPRCYQDTQCAEDLSGKILAEMTDDEML